MRPGSSRPAGLQAAKADGVGRMTAHKGIGAIWCAREIWPDEIQVDRFRA